MLTLIGAKTWQWGRSRSFLQLITAG